MKPYKNFVYLILFLLALSGCDKQYSAHKMEERPVLDEKFYKASLAWVNASIDDYPANADNYYKKALILWNLKNYSNAQIYARKAIRLDSMQAKYHELLMTIYAHHRNYPKALEQAQKAASLGSNNPVFHAQLAELYMQRGDFANAYDYVNKAIKSVPEFYQPYYVKGRIQLSTLDTLSAEESLLKCLSLSPGYHQATFTLLDIYMGKAKYEKAKGLIAKIMEADIDHPELLYKQATLLNMDGYTDSAAVLLKQIIAKDTMNYKGLQLLGELALNRRSYDSAEYYLQKALAISSSHKESRLSLARLYDRQNKFALAISQYEKILNIDSTDNNTQKELVKLKGKVAYLRKIEREKQEKPEFPPIESP
jgi:tetratricopeptide (TPR) repeat protein